MEPLLVMTKKSNTLVFKTIPGTNLMQEQKNIIDCYNKTATNYAEKFIHELDNKHLDKILLKAFIAENNHKGKLIDLGCGPGQTTKFLFDNGHTNIIGTDLSSK
jgi:2-polyprenyl-3-methyl-5-hydroxy-6-metoxy-1,4-benzoquinol methylase